MAKIEGLKKRLETELFPVHLPEAVIVPISGAEVVSLFDVITELQAKLDGAKESLEKLACLGNGDRHGNSVGNCIAQDALVKLITTPEEE